MNDDITIIMPHRDGVDDPDGLYAPVGLRVYKGKLSPLEIAAETNFPKLGRQAICLSKDEDGNIDMVSVTSNVDNAQPLRVDNSETDFKNCEGQYYSGDMPGCCSIAFTAHYAKLTPLTRP